MHDRQPREDLWDGTLASFTVLSGRATGLANLFLFPLQQGARSGSRAPTLIIAFQIAITVDHSPRGTMTRRYGRSVSATEESADPGPRGIRLPRTNFLYAAGRALGIVAFVKISTRTCTVPRYADQRNAHTMRWANPFTLFRSTPRRIPRAGWRRLSSAARTFPPFLAITRSSTYEKSDDSSRGEKGSG